MKQSLFFLTCLLVSIFVQSCMESSIEPQINVDSKLIDLRNDDDPNGDYEMDKIANTLARGIAAMSESSNFRNLVHQQADEQFDHDVNTLFRMIDNDVPGFASSIFNNLNSTTFIVSPQLNAKYNGVPSLLQSNQIEIQDGIDGKILNGAYQYPQVFIPFKDEVDLNSIPIICVNFEGDMEVTYGYQKVQGSDTYQVIEVNENVAKTNLVWVISFNETVFSEEDIDFWVNYDTTNIDSLQFRGGPLPDDKIYKIDQVLIKEDLESWSSGRSDIGYIAAHVVNGNADSWHGKSCIRKIKEKDLNKWKNCYELGWCTNSENDLLVKGEWVDFFVYESDSRRKSRKRTWRPYAGGCSASPAFSASSSNWYSKQNAFFANSFGWCGRDYDLIGNLHWAEDIVTNYVPHKGRARTYYGQN